MRTWGQWFGMASNEWDGLGFSIGWSFWEV